MIITKQQMISGLYLALVGQAHQITGLTRKHLETIIDTYLRLVEKQLLARNRLRLGRIGTLRVVRRKGRTVRVPGSSRTVQSPDRDKVQIATSSNFTKALNS